MYDKHLQSSQKDRDGKFSMPTRLESYVENHFDRPIAEYKKDGNDEKVSMLAYLKKFQTALERLILEDQQKTLEIEKLVSDKDALRNRLAVLCEDQKEFEAKFDHLESENELLITELLNTQEHIEQYMHYQSEYHLQKIRIDRLVGRHPDEWDFSTFKATPMEGVEDEQIIQWEFEDVELNKLYLPNLNFKTIVKNGVAGIVIQRTSPKASSPLVRWPGSHLAVDEITFAVAADRGVLSQNANLNSMGPSDWEMLNCLTVRLINFLGSSKEKTLQTKFDVVNLRNGLIELEKGLKHWPTVLRYDAIELNQILDIGDYHGLEVCLINVQLNEKSWPKIVYRLASVNGSDEAFGQHPRLEFPQVDAPPLKSWFVESNDDRGPRLELRFARPTAIDTNVWHALAGEDQILIAALVGNLRTQIIDLRSNHPSGHNSWDEWLSVSESIKKILAYNVSIARR